MYPVFHITYHNYNCEICLNSSLVRIKSGFMVKSSHIFFNLMSIIAFSFKHLDIFTAHNTIFLHTRTTCEMKCFITVLIWINITLLTNFLQREIVPELWSSFCIAKLFKKNSLKLMFNKSEIWSLLLMFTLFNKNFTFSFEN